MDVQRPLGRKQPAISPWSVDTETAYQILYSSCSSGSPTLINWLLCASVTGYVLGCGQPLTILQAQMGSVEVSVNIISVSLLASCY